MTGEFVVSGVLSGLLYAGVASLFGLGVGAAIDLFKLFGGVR